MKNILKKHNLYCVNKHNKYFIIHNKKAFSLNIGSYINIIEYIDKTYSTKNEAYYWFYKNIDKSNKVYKFYKYSLTNSGKNYKMTEVLFDGVFYFTVNESMVSCNTKNPRSLITDIIDADKSEISHFKRLKNDILEDLLKGY